MATAATTNSASKDYAAARRFMVDGQIRTNKVTDERLIEALIDLPRERFAPGAQQARAYIDDDLPLGGGRVMMEPMVLARLIQALHVEDGDKVLVVGANTGYGAALAARMGGVVTALESDAGLTDVARVALGGLAEPLPVTLVGGPLQDGHPASGPFKAIMIEGAVAEIPARLIEQLIDGGKLVTVERDGAAGVGRAVLVTRTGKVAGAVSSKRVLFDANTAMLPGFEGARSFAF